MASDKQQIYFIRDAEHLIGRNRQTLRRWWEQNLFPKPRLIKSRLAWSASSLHEWIKQNVQGVQNHEEQSNK